MLQSFLRVILEIFEYGNLVVKLLVSLALSVVLTPLLAFIWQFLKDVTDIALPDYSTTIIIFILLFANTALGIWKHLKFKTFDPFDMIWKLIRKTGLCIIGTAVFNVMNLISVNSDFFQDTFTISTQLLIFLYLGLDSIKLIYNLSDEKMPPPVIMQRFKEFSDEKKNYNEHR